MTDTIDTPADLTSHVAQAAQRAAVRQAAETVALIKALHARSTVSEYDEVTVDRAGTFYRLNGVLHQENGPAFISDQGDEHWYLNGVRHRIGGPAITTRNGAEFWYVGGQLIQDPRK